MRTELYTKYSELPPLIDGSLLHSPEMFRLLEKHTDAQPVLIAAFDGKNELGHLLAIKFSHWKIMPPGYNLWYSIHGEGCYSSHCTDKELVFKAMLDKLFSLFDFRHTFIEVRNLHDSRFAYSTMTERDFFPCRDIRIYISLHSRHPEKRLTRTYRSCIRKAEKRGVIYKEVTNDKEKKEAIRLLRKYYAGKIGHHLPPTGFLLNILDTEYNKGEKKSRLFAVYHKDRMIGCSMCIYEKERAYLAYSCGLRKSHPLLYPGIMAVWAAITDAYNRNYPHFEFLEPKGLNIPTGYLNFLLNFGGKQVSTFRWYHYKWNFINKLLRRIYV